MYSSTLSLTSALVGGGLSVPCPGCFSAGKERQYLLYTVLGGPQGRSGLEQKNLTPLGFDPWTVQLVARCNTD